MAMTMSSKRVNIDGVVFNMEHFRDRETGHDSKSLDIELVDHHMGEHYFSENDAEEIRDFLIENLGNPLQKRLEAEIEEMTEAVSFDVLTTPHGEAEYPVGYFVEKMQEIIDNA